MSGIPRVSALAEELHQKSRPLAVCYVEMMMLAQDLERECGEPPSGTEEAVCQDIAQRQQLGRAKYGTTVAENPLSLRQWLQHAYEETLDQSVYLKRAMEELEREPVLGMPEDTELARGIWKQLYPERTPWEGLGETAREEWRRFARVAARVICGQGRG